MRNHAASSHPGSDPRHIIPFLSATCSALWEQGWLTELEADNFRLLIKDHGFTRSQEGLSLLEALLHEKSPVLEILEATYGVDGIQDLFFRWTLVQISKDFAFKVRDFTKLLIQKAELLFNQKLFLYEHDQCEKQTFFSFFLVELANQLFEISISFQHYADDFMQLNSSACWNSISLRNFELNWAHHLGFRFAEGSSFRTQDLSKALSELILILESMHSRFVESSYQLRHNLSKDQSLEILDMIAEDWLGLIERIRAIPLSSTKSWERLEHRRKALVHSFDELMHMMGTYQEACSVVLKTAHIIKREHPVSESDFRELIGALLSKGLSIGEARIAITKLRNYCSAHSVDPRHLLEAELMKIHPILNFEVLHVLRGQSLDQNNSQSLLAEKARVISQKDHILKSLTTNLLYVLILLPALTILSASCGVKTAPRSEVLDLRPALPYHAGQNGIPIPEQTPALPPSD